MRKGQSKHKIRTFIVGWICRNLRAFWEDQTDQKSAVGGPKQILRTGTYRVSKKNWVLPNRAFADPAFSWKEILMIFVANLQMLNSVKLDFFRYPVWWWLIHKLVWNFEKMPCSFMFHLARYNKSRWKSILLKYLWATHFSRQNTRGEVAWIRFRPLTFDWGALATWKSVPSLHFLIF